MRLKLNAFFVDFSDLRQGVHLIAATVGEYGLAPRIETVQTARLLQSRRTRSQIQMIGIAQNNLRLHHCF